MEVNVIKSLLSEQRRELAAAEAIETDFDVAYRLQMQEVMNASLPQSQSGNSSISDLSNWDFLSNYGDCAVTAYQLFSQEISDYEQRLLDHETAKEESKKIENDINGENHDHAFALEFLGTREKKWRELLGIREKECRETRMLIQKRFFDGSTANGGNLVQLNNKDSFRVHVKGLFSEETVRSGGKGEIFRAGIGVSVCDMNDGLVHEVSKEVVGGKLSNESVELKALIEGLRVINTLGLKRITIVCGNNFLYQCVTGKLHPEVGSSLATLLDQVFDLQRKLTHCGVELVEEKDVKFALELARKAAVSGRSSRDEDIITVTDDETCDICLENVSVNQMFSIHGCGHRYCFECMKRHVEIKLHDRGHVLPTCPHDGCKSELKLEDSRKFLTDELFEIMRGRIREVSIPPSDKIYCPNPTCSTLMSASELLKEEGGSRSSSSITAARRCIKCNLMFCMNCKVPWHRNLTCQSYKKRNPYPTREDALLMHLAEEKRWRQCRKCKSLVSLFQGCNHILCRCGHEFCYVCGAERKNNRATCECPSWDEQMIILGGNHILDGNQRNGNPMIGRYRNIYAHY